MSILIKGMEVPKSCGECLGIGWQYVFECNLDDVEEGKKLITCPLIPVPPHGRLIDADAQLAKAKRISGPITGDGWNNLGVYSLIEGAPTIIPAEEEE